MASKLVNGKRVLVGSKADPDSKKAKKKAPLPKKSAFGQDRETFPPGTRVKPAPISMVSKKAPKSRKVAVATADLAREDLAAKKKFLGNTEASLMQQQLANAQSQLQTLQSKVGKQKADEERKIREDELALKNKEVDAKTSLARGVIGAEADTERADAGMTADRDLMDSSLDPLDRRLAESRRNLDSVNSEIDRNYNQLKSETQKIINGTFPLNTYERTLVDSLQKNIDSLKAEQQLANKNFEGGVTQSGIMMGLDRYSPVLAQGRIFQAVSDGISKIQNIEVKGAEALAELKQGFADKRYDKITDSYDRLDELLQEKKATIQKVHDEVQKERDDLAAANRTQSRQRSIVGLLQQGVNDPVEIFDFLNNDINGNAVGDISMEEITGVIENIQKTDKTQGEIKQFLDAKKMGLVPQSMTLSQWRVQQAEDTMSPLDRQIKEATLRNLNAESGADGKDRELSIDEARDLGVEIGTKLSQVRGLKPDSKELKIMNEQNAADRQTMESAYERIQSITGKKDVSKVTKKDIAEMSDEDIVAIAKQVGRMQAPDVARGGGDPQASLAQPSKIAWLTRFSLNQVGLMRKFDPDQVIDLLNTANKLYTGDGIPAPDGSGDTIILTDE